MLQLVMCLGLFCFVVVVVVWVAVSVVVDVYVVGIYFCGFGCDVVVG